MRSTLLENLIHVNCLLLAVCTFGPCICFSIHNKYWLEITKTNIVASSYIRYWKHFLFFCWGFCQTVQLRPEKQHSFFLYAILLAHSCTTYRTKADAFCCYQSIYTYKLFPSLVCHNLINIIYWSLVDHSFHWCSISVGRRNWNLELTLMPVCCVPSGVPANVSDGYVYNRTFCYQTGENNMPSLTLQVLSVVTLLVLTLFPFSIRCSR